MTWLRRVVIFCLVLAASGAAFWVWALHTESGARWVFERLHESSGGAISAARLSGSFGSGVTLSELVIITAESEYRASVLRLRADVDIVPPRVEFSGIDLVTGTARLAGTLDFGLTGSHDINLRARVALEPELTGLDDTLIVHLVAIGDLDRLDVNAQAAEPAATLVGQVTDIRQALRWDLSLQTAGFVSTRIPGFVFRETEVTSQGGISDYDVAVNGVLEHAQTGFLSFDIDGSGDTGSFSARDLSVRGDIGEAAGHATIGWADGLATHGKVELSRLDLHYWIEPWPRANTLSGGVEFDVDSRRLAIEDGRLEVQGTDTLMALDTTVDFAASTVSGELAWQELQLPVGDPAPQVFSRTGRVTAAGTLDSWTIRGNVDVGTPQVPSGRFTIEAGGDRDAMSFRILGAELLGGSVTGEGDYCWRDNNPWSAALVADGINFAGVDARWPVSLDGRVELDGQREPFNLTVSLDDVSGELYGKSFTGNGEVTFGEQTVRASALAVRHGDSRLDLDGDVYGDGLGYNVAIDDIGHFVVGAGGSLAAAGRLSLDADRPFLRIDATSDLLSYGELEVRNLAITDFGSANSMLDIELVAGPVSYAGRGVDTLRVRPEIRQDLQSVSLDTTVDQLNLSFGLSGSLNDWRAPTEWSGQVESLELEYGDAIATLAEPAAVYLSPTRASAQRLCLRGEPLIDFCTGIGWADEQGLVVDAELASLPVDIVNSFVATGFVFDQVISGELHWQQERAGGAGRVELFTTAGTITGADRPGLMVTTDPGRFSFDIRDADLRQGVVSLPMPGFGDVAAEFAIRDSTNVAGGEINGRLDIAVSDMQVLAALMPSIGDASGSLQANLEIDGRRGEPGLQGDIAVRDGNLTYLPVGLRLENIELSAQLDGLDNIEVNGTFRAGEGRANIESRANQSATGDSTLQVVLRGENLTVIDAPDVHAIADADIAVGFAGETLDIDGDIIVQRALVTPSTIGFTRVYESEDVVIVAGELPDVDHDEDPDLDLQITGSLGLVLGKDVAIDLDVATATLTGETRFTWSGDPIPIADGRYDLVGDIMAFGQKLEVVEGGIRFPNVAADDPQVRLRAVRQIYGNSQIHEAGVLVTGALRKPTIEAYTNPLTTRERALTLLLTGSDFNYEQGVGAVDFGTYIAPRIYASYGIGLFERDNVIRVRYDLKRGFGISATSGQRESGMDLSYRFEN